MYMRAPVDSDVRTSVTILMPIAMSRTLHNKRHQKRCTLISRLNRVRNLEPYSNCTGLGWEMAAIKQGTDSREYAHPIVGELITGHRLKRVRSPHPSKPLRKGPG